MYLGGFLIPRLLQVVEKECGLVGQLGVRRLPRQVRPAFAMALISASEP